MTNDTKKTYLLFLKKRITNIIMNPAKNQVRIYESCDLLHENESLEMGIQ